MPVPSARLHLRETTRPLHDRVESAVDLSSRIGSRAAYADLLGVFLGLFEPVEARLEAVDWAGAGLDLAPHLRADLLRDDLRALGRNPDVIPRADDVPAPATLAEGFGVLYVLEGSALGGQIIARQARAELGIGDDETRFFRSAGRDVGRQWRAFGRALDDAVDTPEALEAARRGAEATFEAFERWVAAPLPR